jgi:hypothetical protein
MILLISFFHFDFGDASLSGESLLPREIFMLEEPLLPFLVRDVRA